SSSEGLPKLCDQLFHALSVVAACEALTASLSFLTRLGLVFPLVPRLPAPSHGTPGASPGKSTCPALKPSVLTCRAIQLSGFPIFARLPTLQTNPSSLALCSKAPPRLPPGPTVASGALACWFPSRWLGGRASFNPSAR